MKKNKIALFALSLVAVAAIGVGATLAYFTDSTNVSNVITMGNVDVELTEPKYSEIADDNNEITNVVPNQLITKDPTITVAEGSEDCYIRTKIAFENLNETQQVDLLAGINIDDTKWYLGADGYYYYNTKMEAGDSVVFFNEVQIPETWGNEVANVSIGLNVSAEAIQADNFAPTWNEDNTMIIAWTYADGEAIVAETYVAPVVKEPQE